MAQRLNGQMDVGVFVVEVLDEDVVVIVPEGFDRKRPRRILDRNRVSSRRHGQDDVDRKRPIAAALVVENSIILPSLLQILQSGPARHRRALLCFGVKFAVPGNVGEVRFERHSAHDAFELCTHRRRETPGNGRIGSVPFRAPRTPIGRLPHIRDRRQFGEQVRLLRRATPGHRRVSQ